MLTSPGQTGARTGYINPEKFWISKRQISQKCGSGCKIWSKR